MRHLAFVAALLAALTWHGAAARADTTTGTGTTSLDNSGTVATAGASQMVLARNPARKGCLIQNPSAATEDLFVNLGAMPASTTAPGSIGLSPGQVFTCRIGNAVLIDQINVTAATAGHGFTAKEMR